MNILLRGWFEQDICTYQQIEQEIIRLSNIKKYEFKVLKIFGQTAKPSKQQLEFIEKWRTMGFTVEMLEIAYNKCVDNTNKLNYKYIDTILSNWASNNGLDGARTRKRYYNYFSMYNMLLEK